MAFRDSPNEKGAQKHRFTSEYIDPSKGSAVGYVAKYISKSIDGKHIDSDRDSSLSGIDAAERVVTWARVNGIKQFQFIGGPSVSVWREMRRLREEFKEGDIVLSDLSETEHFIKEKFLAAQKRIMSGVVDFYDALEAEKEYERMCDKRFQEYEEVCAYYEELEALILLGDIEGAYLVGAAPPDMLH
ncbi:replication endonuclease [Vibrio sp. V09_P4A23P171]|uniref:replication endonuclease n=1 Tax=Vibrio sp. V09_P4A23P171 TaxID=1938664 RepID=UPI00403FE089